MKTKIRRNIQLKKACALANRKYVLNKWNHKIIDKILPNTWAGKCGSRVYELNSRTCKRANIWKRYAHHFS